MQRPSCSDPSSLYLSAEIETEVNILSNSRQLQVIAGWRDRAEECSSSATERSLRYFDCWGEVRAALLETQWPTMNHQGSWGGSRLRSPAELRPCRTSLTWPGSRVQTKHWMSAETNYVFTDWSELLTNLSSIKPLASSLCSDSSSEDMKRADFVKTIFSIRAFSAESDSQSFPQFVCLPCSSSWRDSQQTMVWLGSAYCILRPRYRRGRREEGNS